MVIDYFLGAVFIGTQCSMFKCVLKSSL